MAGKKYLVINCKPSFLLIPATESCFVDNFFFFLKDPIYLQSVTIHSANGRKGEGWHVEEYSVALLC
jgi:hypothetical protein